MPAYAGILYGGNEQMSSSFHRAIRAEYEKHRLENLLDYYPILEKIKECVHDGEITIPITETHRAEPKRFQDTVKQLIRDGFIISFPGWESQLNQSIVHPSAKDVRIEWSREA